MILSRKFCVYLHFTPSFTSWRNFASDKAGFCKTNTLQVKNFTLKVLIEVLFMIFVFFYSLLHAIVHKFPNIFVHDSYTVRRHFEKNVLVTGQPVTAH